MVLTSTVDDQQTVLPQSFRLVQNFPNPFNPTTTITFDLPRLTAVNLSVFNISGQKVTTLISSVLPAGTHSVSWDATDSRGRAVATGIYFYRLQSDAFSGVKKMVYLK